MVIEGGHCIFKGKQDSRLNIERKVKVKRTPASIFWMEINFIGLTKRVGLNEVPLIMHVEPMIGGVLFEIGNVSSDVNGGHRRTLPAGGGIAVGMKIGPLSSTSESSSQTLKARTFSLRVDRIGRLQ